MLDSEKLDVEEELEMWSTGEMCTPRQQDLDWREMIKIAVFIWRQSCVSYQRVISDSSVFHKYYMRLFTYSVKDIYANIFFFSDFQWYLGVTSAKHASYVC